MYGFPLKRSIAIKAAGTLAKAPDLVVAFVSTAKIAESSFFRRTLGSDFTLNNVARALFAAETKFCGILPIKFSNEIILFIKQKCNQ